ncbi:regulatory protein RecX [Aestuariibaculum suncheonense]|uniref:Regulatory protein RecX n=1 Tax=Aestuariibaculum suncheonense TaxID=1028745 RepID=A0A8J6Q1F0_9FLAO|nr:RecX family transcriptional regulator [Aestuariibaculum suncheonense]MBD0833948.1 RecX family transcriptional regulator [Aestuariibaculum suncheonense]
MQQSKQTYTVEEAKRKLEHYCAYQERCHQEVVQKLIQMRMIPEAIDVIVVHLLQHNFLNESRFAKQFASGKFKIKHWGKNRIAFELKKKDISKINIQEALNEIEEEEYLELFNAIAEKKAESIREQNVYKKKKKFADYFLYRGWESYLVYEKANELIK